MFQLVEISDLIQIDPADFGKQSASVLEDNINRKYADKVIQGTGLCIGMYDILDNSEGLIGHGTGIVNVNVKFRLVIFRPYKGEILEGVIVENNEHGIRLSVDFFQDFWVPGPQMLFDNSSYNKKEGAWIWTTDEGTDMYFDTAEIVRFRVESEQWHDQTPQHMSKDPRATTAHGEEKQEPPYSILASMSMGTLGPIAWWDEQVAEDGEV